MARGKKKRRRDRSVRRRPGGVTAIEPFGEATIAKLEPARRSRAPFLQGHRAIIQAAVAAADIPLGPILEIGSGNGQLAPLLPREVSERLILTEPLHAGVRALGQDEMSRPIVQTWAQSLPFRSGGLAGVQAFCVLDVAEDLPTIASELARVVKAGGSVIHYLDLTADLGPAFAGFMKAGEVPLPNVFTPVQEEGWPQDVFLMAYEKAAAIRRHWQKTGCRAAAILGPYFAAFSGQEPRADRVSAAVSSFHALADDPQKRAAVLGWFHEAYASSSAAERMSWGAHRDRTASSAALFDKRLRRAFSAAGFEPIESGLRRVDFVAKRPDGEAHAYRSLVVGMMSYSHASPAWADTWMATGMPGDATQGLCDGDKVGADEQHRHLGMHVMVARRSSDRVARPDSVL